MTYKETFVDEYPYMVYSSKPDATDVIADGSITTDMIAKEAIETDQIADGAVTADKIAAGVLD